MSFYYSRIGAGPVVEVSAVTSSINSSRPSSFKSQHHQRAAANSNATPLPSSTTITSSNPSTATSVTVGASGTSHQHATVMEAVGSTTAAAAVGSTVGSIDNDIIKADSYVVVQVRSSFSFHPLNMQHRHTHDSSIQFFHVRFNGFFA